MARDALEPGPPGADGKPTYPNVPRNPDGTVDRVRFPRGERQQLDPKTGEWVPVDLTVRDEAGDEILPPDEAA